MGECTDAETQRHLPSREEGQIAVGKGKGRGYGERRRIDAPKKGNQKPNNQS